jgi:hypothetical protein
MPALTAHLVIIPFVLYPQGFSKCPIVNSSGFANWATVAAILHGCPRGEHVQMVDKETWQELCAQAAKEQDTDKLLDLVRQINQQLEQKFALSRR